MCGSRQTEEKRSTLSDVALGPSKMVAKKEPSDVALHGPVGSFAGTLPEAFR